MNDKIENFLLGAIVVEVIIFVIIILLFIWQPFSIDIISKLFYTDIVLITFTGIFLKIFDSDSNF